MTSLAPHDEARRCIRARIGDLAGHLPGGFAEIKAAWTGDYTLTLDTGAMGQGGTATLATEDTVVRVTMPLAMVLSFTSGAIPSAVQQGGERLLLPDKRA